MPRIIAIDRRPRVVNRRLVTDATGAACCCRDTGLLQVFVECCDRIPAFVVTPAVYATLLQRCQRVDTVPGILVRRLGSDVCYRGGDGTLPITRQQAIDAGYAIIEDADLLTCVEQLGPNSQTNRCGATARDCRECPDQCCLMTIYRKSCPDVHVAAARAKENVCCNHGRQARRTYRYARRTESESFAFINATSSIDPYCPPGCYTELSTSQIITVETGSETAVFTACADSLGGVPVPEYQCERAEHYASVTGRTRLYPGLGRPDAGNNCLDFEERNTFDELNGTECRYYTLVPPIPRRPSGEQVRLEDGSTCMVYTLYGGGNPVCGNITDHVCEYDRNNRSERVKVTTTFQYNISCTSVSFRWRQVSEIRHGSNVDPSCPALTGTLISRQVVDISEDFTITRLRSENCPDTVCDGYAREGTFGTTPIAPGGAFLFL